MRTAAVGAPGQNARQGRSGLARVATDVAGLGVGSVLAIGAALRRGKAVHPHGATHRARLVVPKSPRAPAGSGLLAQAGEYAAVVRFSRSLGVPRPLPDLLGMSIRVPDAYGSGRHQDLLLVSSSYQPPLHRIFLPATDVQQRPYSSSLPYRAGDERFIIGALPDPASPRPRGGNELERLGAAAATGRLRFRLAVAPLAGRFREVAELHVGERLREEADALRFNPWNTGGGLELDGFLNRLRDYAYPLSQAAWRAARRDGGERQAAAERAIRDAGSPQQPDSSP